MNSITVRGIEYDDLPTRVDWFNNPSVYRQMMLDVPITLSGTRQWFSKVVLDSSRNDFSFVANQPDLPSELVAMGGLVEVDHHHRRAELYIVVKPGLTGQGIGQGVLRWLCNFGFVNLNLIRIFLYTTSNNEAARRFYERSGFMVEGTLRLHVYRNGGFEDRFVQGLIKNEWVDLPWHVDSDLAFEIRL